jgi:hypothetical protein
MSFGDIPGWLNVVIGAIALYFLIRTYLREVRPQKPAPLEPSAMPHEPWLTPRRQFTLWLILVLLACGSAILTFWQNRSGARLGGGIVYTLLGEANLDGKMTPVLYIFAGVGNVGTIPSVAYNYRVSVKKDGNTYQGTVLAIPKINTVYPAFPDKLGNTSVSFHDDDALYNKTATIAIQPGNIIYGVLMVSFPNVADYTVLTGGLEIIITFNDLYSHMYTIDQRAGIVTDRKTPLMQLPGMHIEFPPTIAPPLMAPLPTPRPN